MCKIRVAHYIFEDMKNNIPNVDDSLYEINYEGITDERLLSTLRFYYSDHLPIPLVTWCRVNEPDTNLLYKDRFGPQISFVSDIIHPMFFKTAHELLDNPILVISTHHSKSVVLPVYQIKTCFATFTLRNNFYDWKLSVDSVIPLYFDIMDLFDEKAEIPEVYCEGFPTELVYSSFSKNNRRFTCELKTNYDLYTFFYLLRNYLKSLKLRYDFNEEIRAYIRDL